MKIVELVVATLFFIPSLIPATLFAQDVWIVPQPAETNQKEGEPFRLEKIIAVSTPNKANWKTHLEIFGERVAQMTGGQHRISFSPDNEASLLIQYEASLSPEAYSLEIDSAQVRLTASSLKGLAHGTATLMQLIGGADSDVLAGLSIKDSPQHSYRNFMVDMGRNPHSVQLLKETIDLLWFYKLDSLQLHLTDDQRIAFPSTAFPKIWDGKITVEEFKELESYAVARGVTIIPELEVPGHSELLRKHYPEVFGITGTDLARNENALAGIKLLLDEMVDVFSSTPFIHVGGDEAFGVPEELQRDLINKLHAYLKTKGKQTLVWEGPRPGKGENKVNTEVIHINWRTINYPADQILNDGYRVVNAAWDPLYIVDHYPRTNFTMTSPQYIYETLSLTRFKHVNPGISTFAKPIEVQPSDQLIGFCMPWWEGREENFLPLNIPRIIPFAEVAWKPAVTRDYSEFAKRVSKTEAARLAAFYPVSIKATDLVLADDGVFHNQTDIALDLRMEGYLGKEPVVRYTVDRSEPNGSSLRYENPFSISKTTTVRAAMFVEGKQVGHGSRRNFTAVVPTENLALGKPVTSTLSSGSPFSVERITDGGTGNLDFYLGYPAVPEPVDITIDLEKIQPVSRVAVHAYTISGSFEKYSVEVSTDGVAFVEVATRYEKPEKPTPFVEHVFDSRDVRYVRIKSHGNKGYVFDSFSKLVEVQVFE